MNRKEEHPMASQRLTNGLLLAVAVLLLAHLALAFHPQPSAEAETFRLDTCITDRPGDKPGGYLHVVMHGTADVGSP